jgi:hypothetical protein
MEEEFDNGLWQMAEGLAKQIKSYVKERKKLGEFDTSEVYPGQDGICQRIDVGTKVLESGKIWVWMIIIIENGYQKSTLFCGNEKKLRIWVEDTLGTKWLYVYLIDSFKEWKWANGH